MWLYSYFGVNVFSYLRRTFALSHIACCKCSVLQWTDIFFSSMNNFKLNSIVAYPLTSYFKKSCCSQILLGKIDFSTKLLYSPPFYARIAVLGQQAAPQRAPLCTFKWNLCSVTNYLLLGILQSWFCSGEKWEVRDYITMSLARCVVFVCSL